MWGDGGAYGAWTAYLQRWAADLGTPDDAALPALAREDFAPQTWVRLTNRLIEAINGRLHLWSEAVVADLGSTTSEFAYGRGLAGARVGLASVLRLAEHPALPQDLREQLRSMVERQITSMQQSIQDAAEALERQGWNRAAAEARRRSIRDTPLTAVLTAAPPVPQPAPDPGPDPWAFDPARRPRRNLVID